MFYIPGLCVCVRPVCKEAKADLVFLVDGSWSIGDDNFMKITRFLYSTVGSLDLIGADGTQVRHMVAASPSFARRGLVMFLVAAFCNQSTISFMH